MMNDTTKLNDLISNCLVTISYLMKILEHIIKTFSMINVMLDLTDYQVIRILFFRIPKRYYSEKNPILDFLYSKKTVYVSQFGST